MMLKETGEFHRDGCLLMTVWLSPFLAVLVANDTLKTLSVYQLVRVPKKVTVKDILQKYKDSVSTTEPEKAR